MVGTSTGAKYAPAYATSDAGTWPTAALLNKSKDHLLYDHHHDHIDSVLL